MFCTLPPPVVDALEQVSRANGHDLWTGKSARASVATYWRSRLANVSSDAGVADFRPHRLCDTFAVELLFVGVLIEDASALLGHSSVRTTEEGGAAPSAPAQTARQTL